MKSDIHVAIEERLELGHTPEQIVEEFVANGYASDHAQKLVAEVVEPQAVAPVPPPVEPEPEPELEAAPAPDPVSPPATPSVPPTTQSQGSAVPLSASEPAPQEPAPAAAQQSEANLSQINSTAKSHKMIYVGVALFVAALLIGLMVFLGSRASLFSGIFSAAPYENESELLTGLANLQDSLTAYEFDIDYRFVIDERTPETLVFDKNALPEDAQTEIEEIFEELAEEDFPIQEVDARLGVSGAIDIREEDNPKGSVTAEFNLVAEPIFMDLAGTVRLVDGDIYGRIDDIPANFRSYLGEEIPIEEWILLVEDFEIEDLEDADFPMLFIQELESAAFDVAQIMPGMLPGLVNTQPVYPEALTFDWQNSQAAQLAAPVVPTSQNTRFQEQVEPTEEEMEELRQKAVELLGQYPPIAFVGEPKRVTFNDEKVYEYRFDIDFDNLVEYLIAILRETPQYSSYDESDVVELREEVDELLSENRALLNEINRLTDFVYLVRADGTPAGFTMDFEFTFDSQTFDRMFKLEVSSAVSAQNDNLSITAPEGTFDQSLEDILEAQRKREEMEFEDRMAQFRMNNMRFTAELSYNENNFSYENTCEDLGDRYSYLTTDYVCTDSDTAYVVYQPLQLEEGVYCVDSTGFSGNIDEPAFGSVSCE